MFGKNFDRHKMLGYARLLKSKKNQKHVSSKRRKLSINSIYNWTFNKYAYCVTLATCFHVCVWSKLFENLVARTSRNLFTVKKMLHPKKHFFFSLIFIFIFSSSSEMLLLIYSAPLTQRVASVSIKTGRGKSHLQLRTFSGLR